jgi:gas vesicle protein
VNLKNCFVYDLNIISKPLVRKINSKLLSKFLRRAAVHQLLNSNKVVMEDRSKKGLLFLLGVVAGAAAGYYINSEEGKRARRQAAQRVNEFGHEMEERARGQIDQFSSNLNEAVDRSKHYANDVTSNLKSRIDSLAGRSRQTLIRAENAYEANIQKAKRKIKKRIRKLEEAIENEMG